MNTATRAVLLATVASIGLLPLVTGHALLEEATRPHANGAGSVFEHVDIVTLLLLTLAASIPLGCMVAAARRTLAATRDVRAVTAGSTRRSFRGIDYTRIPGGEVTFFTAGFRDSEIYVSEGAELSLRPGPFYAALLHERAHSDQRDVRWLAILSALERALGWVPWSKRPFAMLRLAVERQADERALSAGASRLDLFDAIVAASSPSAAHGAALAEVGTLQRLQLLAEPSQRRGAETSMATVLLASLLTPAALSHLLLWTGLLCAICATRAC